GVFLTLLQFCFFELAGEISEATSVMRFLFLTFALLLLFYVSSGQPDDCVKDGGFCQIGLQKRCVYGSLPYNCGINAKCCKLKPPMTSTCETLRGYCQSLPLKCDKNLASLVWNIQQL
ncbi:hypothetical protein E2320_018426, partial [Naja naja]